MFLSNLVESWNELLRQGLTLPSSHKWVLLFFFFSFYYALIEQEGNEFETRMVTLEESSVGLTPTPI
jgi:hypothetical protein